MLRGRDILCSATRRGNISRQVLHPPFQSLYKRGKNLSLDDILLGRYYIQIKKDSDLEEYSQVASPLMRRGLLHRDSPWKTCLLLMLHYSPYDRKMVLDSVGPSPVTRSLAKFGSACFNRTIICYLRKIRLNAYKTFFLLIFLIMHTNLFSRGILLVVKEEFLKLLSLPLFARQGNTQPVQQGLFLIWYEDLLVFPSVAC